MPIPSRARRRRLSFIEALESRIAPANFQLPAGGGPYTLELDPADAHLHIKNGAGAEVFDQGLNPDFLTITAAGSDSLTIASSAAGNISFSQALSVSITGSIQLTGALTVVSGVSLISGGSTVTTSAMITSGSFATVSSSSGTTLGGALQAAGAIVLNADNDNNGVGTLTVNAGVTSTGSTASLTARDLVLGAIVEVGNRVLEIHASNSGTIDLGTNSGGALGLSNTELDFVHAGTFQVGDVGSSIQVSAVLSPTNYQVLDLRAQTSFLSSGGFVSDVASANSIEQIINEQGITLDGNATLTVNAVGGFVPKPADSFKIIDSTGSATISGAGAFAGKTEGSTVSLGGVGKTITYQQTGNDVALLAQASLNASYVGANLTISEIGAGYGSDITIVRAAQNYVLTAVDEIFNPSGDAFTSFDGKTLFVPIVSLTGGSLTFSLGSQADTLTLDFSGNQGGNVIPAGDIIFNGGTPGGGAGDTLKMTGPGQGNVAYVYTNASDGFYNSSAFGRVDYTGVESIINSGTPNNLFFTPPSGATNALTLSDNGSNSDGLTRLSGANITTTDFHSPSGTVNIQRGTANDTFQENGPGPDFDAGLSLGSSPFKTVNFVGGVRVTDHDVSVSAESIIFDTTSALRALGGGNITLNATKNIQQAAGAEISVVDGVLSLTGQGIVSGNYSGLEVAGQIKALGSGTVLLTGTGGDLVGGNDGIHFTGQLQTAGGGSTVLDGTGGGGSAGNNGLYLDGGTIDVGNGGITLRGTAPMDGDSLGIDFSTTLHSANAVTLETDHGLRIEAGAVLEAASSIVTLRPRTAGTSIDLGIFRTDTFGVSDAMLDLISAGLVKIGSATSGSIFLTSAITSATGLMLATGGSITGAAGLALAGQNSLIVNSLGTVNLTGVVSVPGQTTISGAPGNFINVTLANAGNDFGSFTASFTSNISVRDDGGFTLAGVDFGTKLTVESAGSIIQSGALTGGGTIVKTGAGTLTLSLANTIGNTTISKGGVVFTSGNVFGTGTIFLGDTNTGNTDVSLIGMANGVLTLPNNIVAPSLVGASVATIGHGVVGSNDGLEFTGTVVLNRPTIFSSPPISNGFAALTFSGGISGNVNQLTLDGGGTVNLSGTNTFVGDLQLVGNGTALLVLDGADVIPDATNVFLSNGTTLTLSKAVGGSEAINALTGSGTVMAPGTGVAQRLTVGAGGAAFVFDGNLTDFGPGAGPLTLEKSGAGTGTFTQQLDYSGDTILTGGTFAFSNSVLNNPIPNSGLIDIQSGARLDATGLNTVNSQTFILNASQTLIGSGTVLGNLSGSGTISPGSVVSPGVLTIMGDFIPSSLIKFTVNSPYGAAGTDYDQIVVSGAVSLSSATLQLLGGAGATTLNQQLTLISNTGGGATVAGTSPAEGGLLGAGSSRFSVSYHGGDGNDVTLTALAALSTLVPTLNRGVLTITDSAAGGSSLSLHVSFGDGGVGLTDDFSLFTTAPAGFTLANGGHTLFNVSAVPFRQLVVNGGAGDDTLFVEIDDRLPPGVFFNGGIQATSAGDRLSISGDNQGTVAYKFINRRDGLVAMSAYGTVNYTGLEGLVNTGTSTKAVFNLPAISGTTALFGDDGAVGNRLSRLSGSTFEQVDFRQPGELLIINRGGDSDDLVLNGPVDFHGSVNIGDVAHPFSSVVAFQSLSLNPTDGVLNLAAGTLSVSPTKDLSASAGTLTVSGGTIDGTVSGGLGITKTGTTTPLFLNSSNTYSGNTLVNGSVVLASALAAQNSTVIIGSDLALRFSGPASTFTVGGLAGSGDLALAVGITNPVNLQVGNNNGDASYSGALSGVGSLLKSGTGTQTLTGASTYTGGTVIDNGILQIGSDKALGATTSSVILLGGASQNPTLHATNTFTTLRPLVLQSGTATFEASTGKVLTLAGSISGAGDLAIGSVGTVLITGQANTNSGSTELSGGQAPQMINGVSITAPGSKDIIVTPGANAGTIDSINLTPANKAVSLNVSAPAGGTVLVGSIVSTDATTIKKIVLGKGVMLGDGTDDDTSDLEVDGQLGLLQLDMVDAHATITLGKALAYKATYKNHPNLTLGTVGDDVTIDATSPTGVAGSAGGGGLGKVVAGAWSGPSLIKTSQSIKSIVINTGDFNGSIIVDPDHLGAATVGNIGLISIPNGNWVGTGMQVEGIVAKFLTNGLAEGSVLRAGAFGSVVIKGTYAGSIVATADSTVPLVKGKQMATGGIASVTIDGDFTGMVNGNGAVGNIALTGSGAFRGTVRGGTVGNITAASFAGLGATRPTITAIGSIGNITATAGDLSNYVIAAGVDLGGDAIFGGTDPDTFASFLKVGNKSTAVSVGNVTIKGDITGTTIAAGIKPGSAGYGESDDTVATAGGTVKSRLGAIKFVSFGLFSSDRPSDVAISNAFEAQAMTSIQSGAAKMVGKTYVATFDPTKPQYITGGSAPILVRLLA